jgi:hypothetical protein
VAADMIFANMPHSPFEVVYNYNNRIPNFKSLFCIGFIIFRKATPVFCGKTTPF